MEGGVRLTREGGDAGDVIADQVFHRDIGVAAAIAQGPARHGADVLFELVDGAAVLRPVAGVVDARGDFIDQKAARGDEQFHPHDAHVIERGQDAGGDQDGIAAQRW